MGQILHPNSAFTKFNTMSLYCPWFSQAPRCIVSTGDYTIVDVWREVTSLDSTFRHTSEIKPQARQTPMVERRADNEVCGDADVLVWMGNGGGEYQPLRMYF